VELNEEEFLLMKSDGSQKELCRIIYLFPEETNKRRDFDSKFVCNSFLGEKHDF